MVEAFYATRARHEEQGADGDVLVISADGKGIVMRPDALAHGRAGSILDLTVIVWSSFRVLSQGLSKDHAVAVLYDLTTRTPRRPSYTTSMDSTHAVSNRSLR